MNNKLIHTSEINLLGKTREEMRTLQLTEARWEERIEYLEGGKVPHRKYPRSTLNQFAMWEQVLYYRITKSDGTVQFCLVVPLGSSFRTGVGNLSV